MNHKIPTLVILLVLTVLAQGQSLKNSALISAKFKETIQPEKLDPTVLQAEFVAFDRFGESPFSVLFKDISSGNPSKWLWDFNDGTVDSVQHPVHIFQSPGNYTIKLTVTLGSSSSTIKKVDYIRVVNQGGCDSLNYPMPGDYTLYSIIGGSTGYVSGNNSYGDLAKASYFEEYENGRMLTGAIIEFGVAKRSLTNDIPVYFKVWKNDGFNGKPGTVLDSANVSISSLVADVEQEKPTLIFFDKQVPLDGPFYLGLVLPQIYGDTLAVFTNYNGDPPDTGNGWEQNAIGEWFSYSDLQNSWGLSVDHAIFPIVCQPTGIGDFSDQDQLFVFPNPADDKIFIASHGSIPLKGLVSVYDFSGKVVSETKTEVHFPFSINTSSFSEGLYVVRLALEDRLFNLKFIIQHGTK